MTDSKTLKSGWRQVKFGDVVRLSKARATNPEADGIERYVGLEHIDPEDLRIRRWGLVAEGTTFTTRFKPGHVLFGKRRAYQRKVAVADFEGVCSGDIYVFESADSSLLLPELLPFICQTDRFFEHAVGTSAGSLSPRTNWNSLANFEFALSTLENQQKLLSNLNAVTSAYTAHTDLIESLNQLDKSFCKQIIESYPDNTLVCVGDFAKFSSGKQIRVTELPQEPTSKASVPVYGGNGISGYTTNPLPNINGPTVVVGRVGQFCGVTHSTKCPVWVTDNALYPVQINPSLDINFLALCLRGANLNRGKLGEYLPLITQKVVHAVHIPCPNLEEQKLWVERYNEIMLASESTHQRFNTVHNLRKNILSLCVSRK